MKSISLNHIDLEDLGREGNPIWRITGIYGFPNDEDKCKTWNVIASLNNSALPWLCFGDFNELLAQQEKRGDPPKPQGLVDNFLKVVYECNFMDLGFTGYSYTWSNNHGSEENVQERLDCFLANNSWLTTFPWNRVRHLLKRHSNHLPIIADCNSTAPLTKQRVRKKVWHFEKSWIQSPECEETLIKSWAKWGGHYYGLGLASVCQSMGKAMKLSTTGLRRQIDDLKA